MAKSEIARHPIAWTIDAFAESTVRRPPVQHVPSAAPVVRQISATDIRAALRAGYDDFKACRSDAILLCLIYPLAGLLIGRAAAGANILPLIFPMVAGFALLGPLLATGLYELSRRRERGGDTGWSAAFAPFSGPSIGSLIAMGLILLTVFTLWLVSAQLIYDVTLGPKPPVSATAFLHDLAHTRAGLLMAVIGIDVGAVYAFIVLSISSVAFPLLLDRDCGVETAIRTSITAMARNTRTMITWGAVVAAGLVLGSLPLLLGLTVIMPILGHATWHLYRRLIA